MTRKTRNGNKSVEVLRAGGVVCKRVRSGRIVRSRPCRERMVRVKSGIQK